MNGNLKRIHSQINLFARDIPTDLSGALSWISVYQDFVKAFKEEMSGVDEEVLYERLLAVDPALKQTMAVFSASEELSLHAKHLIVLHRGELKLKATLGSYGFDAPKLNPTNFDVVIASCETNLEKLNRLYESITTERALVITLSRRLQAHLGIMALAADKKAEAALS
jgi:hypothetical protein